jgi:TRAP-type C4-dicarboxylate transport system substrate-binding protein
MKKFLGLFAAICLCATLVVVIGPGSAQAEVIKWKAAMGMAFAKGYGPVEKFIKAVEADMGGQLKIQAFQPGEHPYKPADVMKAVRDGIMQMGFTSNIYTQGLFPQMGLQDLPFLFGSPEEFLAMMEDPEFKDLFNYLLGGPCQKWNQTPIAWFAYGGYMFAGPRWVDNYDSWKGLRIRVYSKPMARMIKLFGGVPVNVTWAEVYTALQRKMIDGFMTATAGAYPAKLYESVKWVTINDYSVGLHWLSVNKDAFNKLPKNLKDKFMASCQKNMKILQKDYFMEDAICIKMSMKVNGVRFKYMDPPFREDVRQKMMAQWQEWAAQAGGKASEMVKRADQFHQKYLKSKK